MGNFKKAALLTVAAYFGIGALSLTAFVLLARSFMNKKTDLNELKKLGSDLQTFPNVKIHRLDFSGLILKVDVLLKNPTNNGFKMSRPFVSVFYSGQPLGSSNPDGVKANIAPRSQFQLEPIYLNFPILQMFSVVTALMKSLQSGQVVKLDVITSCQVDPMWKVDADGNWTELRDYGLKQLRAIPYKDEKEVTLRRAVK